jgi:enediyne biosynthesis protein E4
LLKNNAGEGNHWLGVRLQGTGCNRDAIGATLTWSAGGVTRKKFKSNGGSYLSSHDLREVLGIGPASKVDWVEITWPQPSGRVERLTDLPIDRYVTIVEGKGKVDP